MDQYQAINSPASNMEDRSLPGRISDWLNAPFPFYLNDERKNFLLALFISVCVLVGGFDFDPRRAALMALAPSGILAFAAAAYRPTRRFFSGLNIWPSGG